jgi:hypothetical protein
LAAKFLALLLGGLQSGLSAFNQHGAFGFRQDLYEVKQADMDASRRVDRLRKRAQAKAVIA